jgi:hypothetical protein
MDLADRPNDIQALMGNGLIQDCRLYDLDSSSRSELRLTLVRLDSVSIERQAPDRNLFGVQGQFTLPDSWAGKAVRIRVELLS